MTGHDICESRFGLAMVQATMHACMHACCNCFQTSCFKLKTEGLQARFTCGLVMQVVATLVGVVVVDRISRRAVLIQASIQVCCAGNVLCCAMMCCAMLRCAVLCCAVLCCAVLCCAVLCCAVLCFPMYCSVVPCCTKSCCAVLCCASFAVLCHCFVRMKPAETTSL